MASVGLCILQPELCPAVPVLATGNLYYLPAAANTRYVGVATERVIKQLVQNDDIEIHCIGHSLGAHTCSFLGNAIQHDSSYTKNSLDRITAMDPAGPNFYSDKWYSMPTKPIDTPLDEKLDASDADLVDAIHTDSDTLGIIESVGHVDFYIGKNVKELGKDQAECTVMPCDHSRSHELVLYSISHKDECWAHLSCFGDSSESGCTVSDNCKSKISPDQTLPMTYPDECESNIAPRAHFGYWYDGSLRGDFGVVLDTETCFECIDDGQCRNDMKCDVIGHECVVADCLRDNHCSSGQKCENKKCTPPNCNGRKKRQAETCSSEPSEECKAQLGYCGNPSACPGNVLDNLCPGGQDNKCCVGMPFQEDECTAADGICGDKCACDGPSWAMSLSTKFH